MKIIMNLPNSENFSQLMSTYASSFIYSNFTLLIGHPIERLKVAVQINLNLSQKSILKDIMNSKFSNFFRGLNICVLRQNSKIFYRTFMMSTIPKWIDVYNLHFVYSSILKGIITSTLDTIITSPFENIKTLQMKFEEKTSISKTINYIYKRNNIIGFFFGVNASIAKSAPSWINLFFGYHITKDKRQKQNLLLTILWATIASIPITLITTPFDMIKSQRQALLRPKIETNFSTMYSLVNEFGFMTLLRGFPFRLIHKSLATIAGYIILDMTNNRKINE